MKWRQVQGSPAVLHAVVLHPDEEVVAEFTGCARAQSPRASRVTSVGASSQATAAWFDRAAKDHRRTRVDEQCAALSPGDIAADEDEPTRTRTPYWDPRTTRPMAGTRRTAGCGRRRRSSSGTVSRHSRRSTVPISDRH
ncbi:hypothetical protein BM536_002625 [Streptomyces phaeoluteigriseus]|uniref:PPC domain-containing protein n=1 Tax=Streptomyces phaeoluteigriseus TaxID=114686 RepID=A0A1V6MZ14_9ACTN|nr:DUF296 domain-containing protein [Streptomyces phaeoluteigriseus]OQD57632.1 hypothetical protein BM536_002625 [Streptomyces phaeoluteigriseus]